MLKTNEIQFCKDVVVDQGDGPIGVMGGVCIDRIGLLAFVIICTF